METFPRNRPASAPGDTMKHMYEVYFDLRGREIIIKVEAKTRDEAIKEATRQYIERHVIGELKIYRANVVGKPLNFDPRARLVPVPKILFKVI